MYEALFAAAPGPYLVVGADSPRFTILVANDAYLQATMTTREAVLGQGIFDVFPDPPKAADATGARNLRASLERALASGLPDHMAVQRYDIRRPDGSWEERHWLPVNVPVRDQGGTVRWLIHHVEDVTAAARARSDLRASEARLAQTLMDEQRVRERLERLGLLTEALAPTLSLTEVARVIVEGGAEALGAKLGALGLLSADGSAFELVATVGLPEGDLDRWFRFPSDGNVPWARAVATRAPVFVTSPADFERFTGLGDMPARLGLSGEYAIPLLAALGGVLGVVSFSFAADRPITPDDRRLLDTYARQCAQAMERALLHQAELTARAELEAANHQLQEHALELQVSNQKLLKQAIELEIAANDLASQRDAAEGARRAAEAAEQRVRSILESVTDAFCAVDREWQLTYVNRRAEELWGMSRADLLGRSIWECFPAAVGEEPHRQLLGAMTERRPARFETHSIVLGLWTSVHAYPTPDGLSIYFTDITAEREIAAERARQASLAELLRLVAVAANESPSIDAALNASVEAVCATLDWPIGHAYIMRRGSTDLVSTRVWRLDPPDCCDELRGVSEQLSFRPGTGLVGHALEARRTVWIGNLATDSRFLRRAEAAAAGLVAALAVPVVADDRVAGVMEFFSRDLAPPDDAILRVMDQVGAQLGRVIERERARDDRRLLLQRVVAAQEEERRRLSRDVHDKLGQHLTALQLQLRALRGYPQVAQGIDQHLAEVEALADALHVDARALAFELRPTVLDDVGLASALADYAARWSGQTGVAVELHAEALDVERLDAAIETALYRVIQEALTNVARHAGASHVYITVRRRDGDVHALVEDDGRGFDQSLSPHSPSEQRRLGLLGMEERIAAVAGTLAVESSLGRGTSVFARIPLDGPQSSPISPRVAGADEAARLPPTSPIDTDV